MPDDILSNAAPEEEAEVEGQAPEEGGAQGGQPQKEASFTLDEVRKIIRDEVGPLIQSQVAKGENRINKRIQERFEALEANKAALDLSDDQVAEARKRIIEEEQMNEFLPRRESQGGERPQQPSEDFEGAFAGAVQEIFQAQGEELSMDDPEWGEYVAKEWDNPKGSPARTLAAIGAGVQAKARRKASLREGAPGRVVGGGAQQGSSTKPKTAEEKISQGLKDTRWESSEPRRG